MNQSTNDSGSTPVPPLPDQDIRDLLSDAKLVADYGVRSGRLGKQATLFDAIRAAAAREADLDWSSQETVALQKELGQTIGTIYPVTLPDLRAGWQTDPTYTSGFWHRTTDVLKKGGVVLATAYLIFLCASLTVWQQRAAGLVNELSADKVGQQDKAIDELLVLIGSDKLDELSNPASPLRETFRQKQREIRSVQRSMQADLMTFEVLGKYQSANAPLFAWVEKAAAGTAELLSPDTADDKEAAILSVTTEPPGPDAPSKAGIQPAVMASPAGDIIRTGSAQPAGSTLAAACDRIDAQYRITKSTASLNGAGEKNVIRSIRLFMSALDFDDAFKNRILCGLGAAPGAGYNAAFTGFDIQYRLEIMSLWWLPALYGALGALIYHLREYLSGMRPDPTFMKLMVRVGLSAFAGVAIGWFWIPKDASVLGVSEVPLTPLTIAFLVGFAIDAFVALLDRIVTALTRTLAGPTPNQGT